MKIFRILFSCINMKIEAYLINLKSRPDRLKSFFNQKLPEFIEKVTVIEAIQHSVPEIGCFQSHKKCLELAKLNKLDMVLILEDDVLFTNSSLEYFENSLNLVKTIDNWELFLLSASYGDYMFWGLEKYNDNSSILRVSKYFAGAYSIIVNSNSYDKILEGMSRLITDSKPSNFLSTCCYDVDFEIYSKICEDNIYICLPYITNIIKNNYSDIRQKDVDDNENITFMESTLKILIDE